MLCGQSATVIGAGSSSGDDVQNMEYECVQCNVVVA
jgi:hypothetical protein